MKKVTLVFVIIVSLAFLEYETVCAGNQALDNRHCTMVVIGKDGTADGSTILWHNEELPGNVAGRLVIVPRRNHQPGEMRPCGYEMITQVPVTFRHIGHRYYEGCYPPSTSDWSNGCNQFGVSVLCNAMNSKEYLLPPSTGVAYCDHTEVTMERATTSREAVEIFTSLIDEYGVGADWPNCAWVFGDANEVWYVETGVRHWVARKVRNDEILPISNRYNIGTEWDLASDDLIEYAVAQGWYDPDSGEPFSWKDVYGVPGRQNNTWLIRREARIMDMLSPKWGVITPRDLFELSRDHWEGTSFYHYPPHEASSPICSRSSNFGMVFQLRAWLPTEIGTLMWYRMGAPCSSVYIPIYLGTMEFPEVYTMDVTSGYDPESAWWHFKMLMNYVDQDYENRNPIIRRTWSHFETEELNHTHLLEIEALMAYQQGEIEYMRNILTEYTSQKLMDAYLDTDGDGIPDSYDYNPGQDNLVAHWTFDDDVKDRSGNAYHGTIVGAPSYVDGRVGKALDFDGIDDCVTIPSLTNPVNMTYALWVKADSYSGSWDTLLEFGGDDPWFGIYQEGKIDFYPYVTSSRSITIGQWYHIAVTSDGSESIIYINGQADATGMPNTRTGTGLGIGYNVWPTHFDGLIDDVRIYSRALSAEEILQLYREGFNPNPADGATGVDIDTLLSWSPGTYATSHDVYFCTDWDDVNNANTNSAEYMGISDVNSFDPGGLDANTTYYWRIDEVNEGDPYSPYKGEVWTFSTNMTVYVPSDYPTIQQAIDAAWDGVAIIVEQGRYYENINFKGKYLTLSSTDPNDPNIVANTIIDGNEQGSVVTFSGGEDANSVLSGFTITDGKFSYGGGIYCSHSSPTITKCNITGNSARGSRISYNSNQDGGGIHCFYSSPTITNCTITSNSAGGSGGGIYCRDDSSPTITNCTISGNSSAYEYGGGIYCSHSSPTITNCNIIDNSADGGGGIYCFSNSPVITNCTISGNSADHWGGGMLNTSNSSPTVTNCSFSENSANQGGGGMYNRYNSSPTLTDCVFSGNGSGGMYNNDHSSPTLTDCVFSGNGAGGMRNYGSNPTLANCTFSGNSAYDGGGMYNNSSSPTITNCTFSANSARYDGGGMANNSSSPTITNCTFSANSARYDGGGIYSYRSEPNISNCILWGNQAPDGPEIYLERNSNASVSYTDLQGGKADVYVGPDCTLNWGHGNIDDDPSFAFDTDLHLMRHSPCIDAGDPDYIAEPNETDPDGNPRIMNGRIDMGVYEHNPAKPSIAIPVSEFSFTGVLGWPEPDPNTLLIRNCGGTPLNWEIVVDCNWLQPTPATGQSTGEIDEVTLTVDLSWLMPGYHTCTLTVLDPDAVNSPRIVTVTLDVFAEVIYVPSQAPTIQHAIDYVLEQGTVIVEDGTYTGPGNKHVDFKGKTITVMSENGPNNCIIGCQNAGRGFYFHSGEDTNSILDGFTITNGSEGAIYCAGSSPTITNCIITGNSASRDGGGMYNSSSSPTITNCTFIGNSAVGNDGGAINNKYSSPTITNCTFTDNSAYDWGGAVRNIYSSSPTFTNCVFTGNSSDEGGGMFNYDNSSPTLTNCIFWGNTASSGGNEIYNYDTSSIPVISYCDIAGCGSSGAGWDDDLGDDGGGNIDADPCFVYPGYWDVNDLWVDGDYHLLRTSPCIDAGTDADVYTDIEGNVRPFDFPGVDNNGELPEFDMGTYELTPIQARMQFTPPKLNCKSKGKFVKAHVVLPEGFVLEDVDVNAPAIAEPMHIESEYLEAFVNDYGSVEIEVTFDRQTFCESITETGEVEVTVVGSLTTGQYFYGTDTIRIIDRPSKPRPRHLKPRHRR